MSKITNELLEKYREAKLRIIYSCSPQVATDIELLDAEVKEYKRRIENDFEQLKAVLEKIQVPFKVVGNQIVIPINYDAEHIECTFNVDGKYLTSVFDYGE